MLIQAANIIGGALLAEPVVKKITWLEEPAQRFGDALRPYRSAVGIAQMGVAGAALLCNQGIIDVPVLYNAGYLDIGLGVLSGGLLAEDVWDRYLPRISLCNPLHYHEAYIGLGTMATGVIGLL